MSKPDRMIVILSVPVSPHEDPPDEWVWDDLIQNEEGRPVLFLGMSEDVFHDDDTTILPKRMRTMRSSQRR